MGRTQGDQLRDLLFHHVQAVSEDAIKTDGKVAAEQVEALERLARLVEICHGAQPPPPRKRWPIAAALGITLLVVSVLLFARVSETEIELDIAVSEASFVVPTQQVLTDIIKLAALGATGLREIRLPLVGDRGAGVPASAGVIDAAIRLSVASDGEREGTITLSTTALPAGTRVRLKHTEVPHHYHLSLKGSGLVLRVAVNGTLLIGQPNVPAEQITFGTPKSIRMEPAAEELGVDLVLPGTSQSPFSPHLSVIDLALSRIDEFTDLHRTMVRRVSTILSGTLYFEALHGEKRLLRQGEVLHFRHARGAIRTLHLHQDHMTLQFHGYVQGMDSGSEGNRRSLMPTYLEWLRARHGLSLLWGTTLYLFGLIAGVLHWWRKPS